MSKVATKGPAATAYARYQVDREPYLVRFRDVSRLTVTSLCTEQGSTGATSQPVPWQTFGAYAINTLSAKGVLGLFPPGIPYIKVKAVKSVLDSFQDLDPDTRGKLRTEIDKGLSAVEREFAEECEADGDRMVAFDAMRHMLVGGNHGIHFQKTGKLRGIPLESYVVSRDRAGNLIEAVIEDPMSWWTLSEDVRQLAMSAGYEVQYQTEGNKEPSAQQAPINVYTRILRLANGQFRVNQECWGQDVPGTSAVYNADALPYLFLRMVTLKNESYGRSFCEDYLGDLQTLDGLWQIVTEGSAAVALLKWLVKPGGVTNKDMFAKLANGGVMTGDPADVAAVMSEKQGELQVAAAQADKIEARLARIFLLYSSIQRAGERVTREEIVTMRQDLDAGLGGVYSNLAVEWQQPQAMLKMAALQRLGRVTKLPPKTTKLTILTGDAALGRQIAGQAVDQLLQRAATLFPQVFAQYVDVGEYLQRAAAAEHVDPDGLLKTAEQLEADVQAQQNAALADTVAPEVAKTGGQLVLNSQQAALDSAAPVEG